MDVSFRKWLKTEEFLSEAIDGGRLLVFLEALKIIAQSKPLFEQKLGACDAIPEPRSTLDEILKAMHIMRWNALIEDKKKTKDTEYIPEGEKIPPEAKAAGETDESIAAKHSAAWETYGNIHPYLLRAACRATGGNPHLAQDVAQDVWQFILKHITKKKTSGEYGGKFAPIKEDIPRWALYLAGRIAQRLRSKGLPPSPYQDPEVLRHSELEMLQQQGKKPPKKGQLISPGPEGRLSDIARTQTAIRRGRGGAEAGEEAAAPHLKFREPRLGPLGVVGREEEAELLLKSLSNLKDRHKALALAYQYGITPEEEIGTGTDPWAKAKPGEMTFRPGLGMKTPTRSLMDVAYMFDRRALGSRERAIEDTIMGPGGSLPTLRSFIEDDHPEVSDRLGKFAENCQGLVGDFAKFTQKIQAFHEKMEKQQARAIGKPIKDTYKKIISKTHFLRPTICRDWKSKECQGGLQILKKTAKEIDRAYKKKKGSIEEELNAILGKKDELETKRNGLLEERKQIVNALNKIARKNPILAPLINEFTMVKVGVLAQLLPPTATPYNTVQTWVHKAREELKDMPVELPPVKGEKKPRFTTWAELRPDLAKET